MKERCIATINSAVSNPSQAPHFDIFFQFSTSYTLLFYRGRLRVTVSQRNWIEMFLIDHRFVRQNETLSVVEYYFLLTIIPWSWAAQSLSRLVSAAQSSLLQKARGPTGSGWPAEPRAAAPPAGCSDRASSRTTSPAWGCPTGQGAPTQAWRARTTH